MSKLLDHAKELRACKEPHYNCFQATVLPFARDLGYNEDQVFNMGKAMNSGLRTGGTCGAIVAGLSVLGMYGKDDPRTVSEYYKRIRDNHEGMTNCADLLRVNKEKGGEKKPHCDGMVYECIQVAESLVK